MKVLNLQLFIYPLLVLQICTSFLYAEGLQIEHIRVVNRKGVLATPLSVIFDLSWDHAWKNEKNHDAAWVFMKFGGSWNNHVKLLPEGHKIMQDRSDAHPVIQFSADSLGFFIYPGKAFRGRMNCKLQIRIATGSQRISQQRLNELTIHGIEMVYIPEGKFTLGSPDQEAIKRASFYRSDGNGNPDGLITIDSENAMEVGPEKGKLYYWSENALYNGDQQGPVPSAFPKGYDAFYIMKYELNQGQYAAFLNDLPDNWTYTRSPIGGRDYHKKRGGIRFEHGKYIADNPHRPMNYISFTDGLAYTDWAALRPVTELEYEKAARGPANPIEAGFVWGTNNYDQLERYVDPDAELRLSGDWDEGKLTDETRPVLGASYYWVMDLSGSLWEKVITIGNPVGRQYKGTHGDGNLNFGHATNEDWPKSDDEVGGFGYRGGGYYQIGTQYSDFNPHSPIGYRYYGAWSGGPRYISYGYRAGRTAAK